MSQQLKGRLYRALQGKGVQFEHHYRDYTVADLQTAWDAYREPLPADPTGEQPERYEPPAPYEPPVQDGASYRGDPVADAPEAGFDPEAFRQAMAEVVQSGPTQTYTPAGPDPDEMAGQRLNTQDPNVPIRIDELGRQWFQEEVRKPAMPKPRGRRVLDYMDSGTEQRTVVDGKSGFTETFEVAGQGQPTKMQVKITLPSYQVGIYKDPRLPFKVHTYNGAMGFAFFEVQEFYGGAELVPDECKRIYVENDLCYDIRTTVRAIQAEYNRLQDTKEI